MGTHPFVVGEEICLNFKYALLLKNISQKLNGKIKKKLVDTKNTLYNICLLLKSGRVFAVKILL